MMKLLTIKVCILNSIVHKEGSLKTSYKILNVKPKNITKQESMGTAKLGTEISLKDTTLGNTIFKIKNIELLNVYTYTKEVCESKDNCRTLKDTVVPSGGNTLLVIYDELKLDDTTQYYKNSYKDFYGDFITLRYEYKTANRATPYVYNAKLKNVTPRVVTDRKIYEVQGSITRAEKIDMIIKVRNKYVTLNIK